MPHCDIDLGMSEWKAGIDRSSRAHLKSSLGKRILFERSLRPSAATLVVVPLALLEHWYEQIVQHVGLHYFARYEDGDEHHGHLEDSTHVASAEENGIDTDELAGQASRAKQRGIVYLDGLGEQTGLCCYAFNDNPCFQ